MKKAYFRFAFKIAILTVIGSLIVFSFLSLTMNLQVGWGNEGLSMLKTVLYLALPVCAFSIAVGLPSFFLKIDACGIRKGLRGDVISWSDVESVKIVGFLGTSYFNKIIFREHGQVVEMKLFVFSDQKQFVREVQKYLPWAGALDLENLPTEARK